jgi:tetratricopeptide (TPR) repeat protein
LSALRSLSNWARETLGEKLALIQESEKQLERVTTPSLRAVQLYTEARTLFDRGRVGLGPAEQLLRQVLEIDPEFASAYIWLAWVLRNQRESSDNYIQHAERAFQQAERTSVQERYFIHGSYYRMKDELDRAIHAFEALSSLYPDHFWATRNLAELYRKTGQEPEVLYYSLRLADLRPSNFRYTYLATTQLLRRGDLARTKTYVTRAVELVTPDGIDREPDTTIQLMWFPAFEALLYVDPETALREANRSLEGLRSVQEERFVNDSPMGAFYLTLGKIELAREWFEKSTEPGAQRQVFLAATAYVEDDHEAMTEHLQQIVKAQGSLRRTRGRGPFLLPTSGLLLNRGGLLSEADLNPSIRPSAPDLVRESIIKNRGIRRGILAVSRDNTIEGLKMLGDALSSISLTDSISNLAEVYFMGSEILAEAWREQGDLTNAAQVLRAALEKEAFLLIDQSVLTGPLWLKLQAQLSQLYREMGRDEDARKIEDEPRKRLALADPNHPILLQLDRTKESALLEFSK